MGTQLELIYSKEDIAQAVSRLAAQIEKDYAGKSLLLVAVLRGAFLFLADLVREISLPIEVDFVRLSSYGHRKQSSGTVRLLKDIESDIQNRHVLIVEEIIDTGYTLHFLYERLKEANPASLEIITLLDKPMHRKVPIQPKYVGLQAPDRFLVGYGLDYQEKYRNLPAVYALD